MSDFILDSQLAADSIFIMDGPLSQFRWMNDQRYSWLVLVPRLDKAVEWVDLELRDQHTLLDEINVAASALRANGPCDKLNIGALGNIVRQLHIHVISRRVGDAAWPGPVWGQGVAQRLNDEQRVKLLSKLRQAITFAPSS